MTTTDDKDRKKLSLSSGRLSLGKSIETSQVRQSFSHGRTKTVQVERRRKRVPVPNAADNGLDAGAEGGAARTLTPEERAARTRALQEGLRQQESATQADEAFEATPAAATAATQDAEAASEAVEPEAPEVVEELDRREAERREAQRIADDEEQLRAVEAARLAELEEARQAKAAADRTQNRAPERHGHDAPDPGDGRRRRDRPGRTPPPWGGRQEGTGPGQPQE
jgi:translation initiation factor IF-2